MQWCRGCDGHVTPDWQVGVWRLLGVPDSGMHAGLCPLRHAVEDEEFWWGVAPVSFGPLPQLQDSVFVVGYPVGGDTVRARCMDGRIGVWGGEKGEWRTARVLQVGTALQASS